MSKKIIVSAVFSGVLLCGLSARALTPLSLLSDAAAREEAPQVKDDLFAGTEKFAQGASSVSEVNLDKNMLGMVRKKGDAELASKLDFIVVHTYEYDKPGQYRKEDLDTFRKRLTDGSWNCFIHTQDRTDTTDICSRSADHGETNELVIMTSEAKELTFIHMRGRMSLAELRGMNRIVGGIAAPPAPPAPPAPARTPLPAPAAPSSSGKPAAPAPPAPGL